jgi:nucleoside 2-deoxyribosyltransferase
MAMPMTAIRASSTVPQWRADCAEIRSILTMLRECSTGPVFCALEAEAWGECVPHENEVVVRDWSEMRAADLVVCYYAADVRSSLLLELGWAIALQKRLILCVRKGIELPFLLRGLSAILDFERIDFTDAPHLIEELRAALRRTIAVVAHDRRSDV